MATEPVQVVYCPVCGQPKSKLAEKLYGVPTCRRCIDGFTKRRSIAGIIDWIVLPIVFAEGTGLLFAVISLLAEDWSANQLAAGILRAFSLLVTPLAFFAFCAKDGFSGYSLGKVLCGMRAIHQETGQPVGFFRSIARNFPPTAVFLLAFVIALQIRKGPRFGDGMAKSKVIWQKYADSKPFAHQGKTWVAEQTDMQPVGEPLPVGDTNPYRAPLA